MNPDLELLELAAKAAGVHAVYEFTYLDGETQSGPCPHGLWNRDRGGYWNPMVDDGDAMRLMVKLGLYIEGKFTVHQSVREYCELGELAAVRRAIVRAAAEIGKAKP